MAQPTRKQASIKKRANTRKKPLPQKELKKLLQSLPHIQEKQRRILREHLTPSTYKKLRKLSIFLDQHTINSLKKETQSLIQMAADLTSDTSFSDLVER